MLLYEVQRVPWSDWDSLGRATRFCHTRRNREWFSYLDTRIYSFRISYGVSLIQPSFDGSMEVVGEFLSDEVTVATIDVDCESGESRTLDALGTVHFSEFSETEQFVGVHVCDYMRWGRMSSGCLVDLLSE